MHGDEGADTKRAVIDVESLAELEEAPAPAPASSPALPAGEFEDYLLARMAERYAQAAEPPTTWQTDDLA